MLVREIQRRAVAEKTVILTKTSPSQGWPNKDEQSEQNGIEKMKKSFFRDVRAPTVCVHLGS